MPTLYEEFVRQAMTRDANDQLYALESGKDYNPTKCLAHVSVPVLAINFADDEVNPLEIGVMEQAKSMLPSMQYHLIDGPETNGHYSCLDAKLWKGLLSQFIQRHHL